MAKVKNAIILAAGLGSRIPSVSDIHPKGFISFEGISLIERSLIGLIEAGIEHIILGVGYKSEYYKELSDKYRQITCCFNPYFEKSGSLETLLYAKNHVQDDFLLLESDLLYDLKGLDVLIHHPKENVILASSQTNSGDEVYLEADDENFLQNVSKNSGLLRHISGELVGISKISHHLVCCLEKFVDQSTKRPTLLDYETSLVKIKDIVPIFVHKEPNYIWTEIDNLYHYHRAKNQIWSKLKGLPYEESR